MVCRFLDGFDYYSTSELTRKWNAVSITPPSIISSGQRNGAGALHFDSASTFVFKTFDDQPSWIVGFALNVPNGFPGQDLIHFNDNIFLSAEVQCSLHLNTDGTLEVSRGSNKAFSVTGGQSVATLSLGVYQHIEMKVTISNSISADSCKVRVNEVDVITVATGQDLQNTSNSTANVIQLSGFALVGNDVIFDDLYIFDGTDGPDTVAVNNDFAGDNKILTHWPNGNGATNDLVGSDGNSVDNYLLVQEALTDDDSTYVESTTPGEIDLYEVENLKETAISIEAIQVNNVTRKTEAGISTMRSLVRPLTTNFAGVTVHPSYSEDPVDSYVNEFDVYDKDPETDLAWTESGFNTTEFGIEIVT